MLSVLMLVHLIVTKVFLGPLADTLQVPGSIFSIVLLENITITRSDSIQTSGNLFPFKQIQKD